MHMGINFSTSLPAFVIFLYSTHLNVYEVVSCGFALYFPNDQWCCASFHVLIGLFAYLWKKSLFEAFALNEGFLHSSVGKESACSAGDPGLIPGWRRSPGEGIGYPLQYSWTSYGSAAKESACNVEDLGLIPGLEDPLEKGTATHSSILAWRIPWTTIHGVTKSQTWLSHFRFQFTLT